MLSIWYWHMCKSKWRRYRDARLWHKNFLLAWLKRRKNICRGNPFYLTLFSPWLLLTALCCHWIFSNIINFRFPDNLIGHAQCLCQCKTMVKLLSLFLPILAKRLTCSRICGAIMHNLYVRQCHSEIDISSVAYKYELKRWIWNFPIDHYHYRFVLSDRTTEKNGWMKEEKKPDVRKTEMANTMLHPCTDLTSLAQPQIVSAIYSLHSVYIYVMPF